MFIDRVSGPSNSRQYCIFGEKTHADFNSIPHQDPLAISAEETIYDTNCASRHGANLEGQLNWQKRSAEGYLPAPPHDETGNTWHHQDKMLFEFMKYGPQIFAGTDYKSIMPAYEGKLTDKEIWRVLAFIKSKWPDEIQKKHTEAFSRQTTLSARPRLSEPT